MFPRATGLVPIFETNRSPYRSIQTLPRSSRLAETDPHTKRQWTSCSQEPVAGLAARGILLTDHINRAAIKPGTGSFGWHTFSTQIQSKGTELAV